MRTLMLLPAVVVLAAGSAAAGLTPSERACQAGRARTVYQMIVAQGECLRRCHVRAGTPGACDPPDGAGVAGCIRATKARATRNLFGRACRRDCPDCYGRCGADVAAGEVEYSSGLVASFAPLVYCPSPDDPATVRCRAAVATASAAFARRYGGCFARCQRAGCNGGGAGDARTIACTAHAASAARAAIDARCETVRGGGKPSCYSARTGAESIDLVRAAVDAGRPVLFCPAP